MPGKLLLLSALTAVMLCFAKGEAGETFEERQGKALRHLQNGNYRDAYALFGALALEPEAEAKDAIGNAEKALECLNNLGEDEALEPFIDAFAAAHAGDWRVLAASARLRLSLPDRVYLLDGKYVRTRDWRRDALSASERDRAVAMRIMKEAEKLLLASPEKASQDDKRAFYRSFAEIVGQYRLNREAWRFSSLTDLEEPPEYEQRFSYYSDTERGAPVDADGNPLYYALPDSWESALNDGERWRWLLGKIAENGGGDEADYQFASFLMGQFGVHTLGMHFPVPRDVGSGQATGAFAVRTLSENETIARLANGVKRFALPDEYNYIRILRALSQRDDYGVSADRLLAQIFENRQQYPKAVSFWTRILDSSQSDKPARQALRRITGNNGMLEPGPVEPAGRPTRLSYLFRNGDSVRITAQRLDEKALLADIRRLYKANRRSALANNPALNQPEQLGRIVAERNLRKYAKEITAEWEVPLAPLPDHLSRRATIEMPFTMAGCYLVTATMKNGNTSRAVLWLADLALVRKSAFDRQVCFLADAATGNPVPGATLSFFGYSWRGSRGENMALDEFAETTDGDGLVILPSDRLSDRNWLITAEADGGRLAYLGFSSIWADSPEGDGEGEKAYIITDRPVYRPDQQVRFKVWLGRPDYGNDVPAYLANRSVTVEVSNPRGETIYRETLTSDAFGGVSGELSLDATAPLGQYGISVNNGLGWSGFRLEEYKKPEYEVTLETPDKPLLLGDSAQLKVLAKYYFGSPVANARVKYTIVRTPYETRWYPPWRWDWLYGSGSWWTGYDYDWLPGWNDWGTSRPRPAWMPPRPFVQPEVVAEGDGALDADGVFRLTLDTFPAKELFGHQDHQYQITVEVTDQSRRTIVGSGRVVATRQPFSATIWTDRGWYRVGQEMTINLRAHLPLGGGVRTTGTATLYRIAYDADGTAHETEAAARPVRTDADGNASFKLEADAPGQFRLACVLEDADGNKVEGGAVLTIRGEGEAGDFRYAALELVPDRRDYQPGDQVNLAVNAENSDAFVLLFPRSERAGGKPMALRLKNGGTVVPLAVTASDQPNFFCDAVTVRNGAIHQEVREIFVPPASKTIEVAVKPDKDSYLPGDKARFEIEATGPDGKPVQGQCVVSIYDKSVEYVTGGSNVGDIRAFFWQWKRSYSPYYASSLNRHGYNVFKKGDVNWEPIGIFGGQEADWNDDAVYANGRLPALARGREQVAYKASANMLSAGADMAAEAVAPSAMPPPMAMAAAPMQESAAAPMEAKPEPDAGSGGTMAETTVRSQFADTALWIAALTTDASGKASFELTMPENLTAWKARTWTMGPQTSVGEGAAQVETRKNVIVRPQAPRFLTQKDQVVLSANLHNYLPRAKAARAELVLEGGLLEAAEGVKLTQPVQLSANGEARVDWLVNARRPGEATVIMKLLTDEESDAAEIRLPVVIHGARRVENFGGIIRRTENETTINFTVPAERLADKSRLELTFAPTLAGSLLEALPYLIEYPYGCTEQTLNRFLPAVMTRKYLDNLGLSLSGARGMIDNRRVDGQSAQWLKTFGDARSANRPSPVFDDAELFAMVKRGVERLSSMQVADGGWGWFSGAGERSWPHTTAVVVNGLLTARENGAAIPSGVIAQGIEWLRAYRNRQIEELKGYERDTGTGTVQGKRRADNLDAFIQLILVEAGYPSPDMRDFLHRDRLNLSLSGLAMHGIALHEEGADNFLEIVAQNLAQYVKKDAENGTAWLDIPGGGWWWWYNDGIETQAWYLMLLSRLDPQGETTAGVAKYLLRNRKNGTYWRSTRDTAYAIEALTRYAAASGESNPDMTVTVYYDGARVMERRLTAGNLLDDQRFLLEGAAVEAGDHSIRIVRSGEGPVYFGGALDLFSLEDPIAGASGDLKVERAFFKLVRQDKAMTRRSADGQAVTVAGEANRRVAMPGPFAGAGLAGVAVEPGDLVEVELTITAKNDYEYLVFEDMKAAGLESVELLSGYTGNALGAYVEYRDQKVVLFVRSLPRGTYAVSYRFRAETPGSFSALPVFGGGMYATDLFANSDEMKVKIVEEGVYDE